MDIILDGSRGLDFEGTAADAFAVVVTINDHLRKQGRGIKSIAIDGEPVDPSSLMDSLKERPVDSIGSIEVVSCDIAELVAESLERLQEAVPELPGLCHEIASVFQSDAPREGLEPFQKLVEVWGFIKSREHQVAAALGLNLEDLRVSNQSYHEHLQELNTYLNNAIKALGEGDTVALSDLLEYELAPHADIETQIVEMLRDQVRKSSLSD